MCPDKILGLYRFLKSQRLRKTKDFDKFRANEAVGLRGDGFLLKVLVAGKEKEDSGGVNLPRIGIITSRKVGHAVVRNRVRRIVREIFRLNPEVFRKKNDYLFIAFKGISDYSYAEIKNSLLMVTKKISNNFPKIS